VALYKTLQSENYQLRDYIISLQSRLLETHNELPPPPSGVDLSRQHPEQSAPLSHQGNQPQPPQQPQAQASSPNNNGNHGAGDLSASQISELQMAAQAAAAAQHGPTANNGDHQNAMGSFDAGDYADKRQKVDDSTTSGQPPSTLYNPNPQYEPAPNAHS
jgi:hypothetical protein